MEKPVQEVTATLNIVTEFHIRIFFHYFFEREVIINLHITSEVIKTNFTFKNHFFSKDSRTNPSSNTKKKLHQVFNRI